MLAAANIEGVSRYLCFPDTNFNKAKRLLKPEFDHLIALGHTVLLNWEQAGGSWMNGYPLGRIHGTEARKQVRALGVPDHHTIVQSVDTNAHPDLYGVALEYQQGFNDGGGVGPQGMYGTDGVLRQAWSKGLIVVAWQTMSRGWYNNANDCPHAGLIQRTNHGTFDRNDVMAPHWGAVNECLFGYRCRP